MLSVAKKLKRVDYIELILDDMRQNNITLDADSVQEALTFLVSNNQLKVAEEFFKESKMTLPNFAREKQTLTIDLHGLHFGSTYLALNTVFKNLPPELTKEQKPFFVICGKGLHSNAPQKLSQHPVVKRAVFKFIEDKKSELGKCTLDPNNSGRFIFQLKPPSYFTRLSNALYRGIFGCRDRVVNATQTLNPCKRKIC